MFPSPPVSGCFWVGHFWLGCFLIAVSLIAVSNVGCDPAVTEPAQAPLEPKARQEPQGAGPSELDWGSARGFQPAPEVSSESRAPRVVAAESPSVWQARYQGLDLAQWNVWVQRADRAFREDRRDRAQRSFLDPERILDLDEFRQRERNSGELFAVRPEPGSGKPQFVVLSQAEFPQLYARHAELRWLRQRRVELRKNR